MAISPANQRQHKLDLAFQARSVSEEENNAERGRTDFLCQYLTQTHQAYNGTLNQKYAILH
jgi:hypothetical protein